MKKLLCIVLTIALIASCSGFALAAHDWDNECLTECNGECGQSPLIIVPGIMQSQVYVQDGEGNDLLTSDGFPIVEGMDMAFMFDTVALGNEFKNAIGEILKDIALHDRDALLDTVLGILDESFRSHYFNPDGTRVNDVAVDEYWHSLAVCKETPEKSYNYAKGYSKDENGNVLPTTKYKTEYDFINRQVDISQFCEEYGYDHTYYYSYSSFGNILDAAAGLAEYIDMVKAQTGHDKVSIVFISLGGTIGNVFLADYCDPEEIDRIVFAAAAIDGSYLLSDLMAGKSTLKENEILYNDLIPNIVALAAEEYMSLAYLGNAVARAIPSELFNEFLDEALTRAVNEVLGKLLRNCQSMWALIPSGEYPALSEAYISDSEHAELKKLTDRYYNIQKNAGATMKKLSDEGMKIFVICGYNLELPALIKHYNLSADNIIQSTSTSVGATFANVGETLPKDYQPAIDASYISPDRIVDAGTCALPDTTFFVKNQSHLKLQSSVNDVIGLCCDLITDKTITDARENSGGYPQFNEYRDLSTLENLMRKIITAGEENVPAEVQEAFNDALKVYESRVWSQDETSKVEEALYTAMYKADMLSKNDSAPFIKYKLLPVLEKITKFISEIFRFIFKGHDYWILPINIL